MKRKTQRQHVEPSTAKRNQTAAQELLLEAVALYFHTMQTEPDSANALFIGAIDGASDTGLMMAAVRTRPQRAEDAEQLLGELIAEHLDHAGHGMKHILNLGKPQH